MLGLSPDEIGILALSLRVALVSVVCSLPLAILVAYGLARSPFPGKTLVDAIVHLPLVLPPVVVGFALLVLFGKRGPIGSVLDEWFGIVFAFRWTGAALASAIMGFPLMVRAIRLSIDAIDQRLEVAARTLGGSRALGVRIDHAAARAARASSPARCCRSRAASANSARRSRSCRTFPARPRRCRWRSTRSRRFPAATRRRCGCRIIAVVLSIVALAASEWLTRRSRRRARR